MSGDAGDMEIEQAVTEHLQLFGRESQVDLLQLLRRADKKAVLALLQIQSPI